MTIFGVLGSFFWTLIFCIFERKNPPENTPFPYVSRANLSISSSLSQRLGHKNDNNLTYAQRFPTQNHLHLPEKFPESINIGRISQISTIIHQAYYSFMILNEIMGYPVELKAFHPCYNFSGERYRKNLLHEYKVHDEKLFEYVQDVIEM